MLMPNEGSNVENLANFLRMIDEKDRLNNERQKLAARLLAAYEMGARLHFKRALYIQSHLHKPERTEKIEERYKNLYKAPRIAQAIIDACIGDPKKLDALRSELAENGGLIERHPDDEFTKRSTNPNWVITEASGGRIPSPEEEEDPSNSIVPQFAADCQSLLPDDSDTATRVAPLLDPQKGDLVYDPDLQAKIASAHPASIGLIDQIAVEQQFAHLGLAAEARYRNLVEIIRKSTKGERQHPIEHMIGLAFCIQGLEVEENVSFMLHEYDQQSLSNMISLFVNENSKRCPAKVVGRLRNQKVPVTFEHEGKLIHGNLIVDWFYLDHQTDQVKLEASLLH